MKTLFLASALLIASGLGTLARGNISLQITDLLDGTTRWELLGSDTTYTVGSSSLLGNYGEAIILPKTAFDFDYSQTFAVSFTNPIGRVSNLTDGTSTALFRIVYNKSLDRLAISAGLMAHALGDQFQITDFSSSTMAVPMSTVTTKGMAVYYQAGAWHNETGIEILPATVPEPAVWMLAGPGMLAALFRGFRPSKRRNNANRDSVE